MRGFRSDMKTLKIKTRFAKDTAALNDAELGRLIRGMLQYASSGAAPALSGTERALWPAAKADIDEQRDVFQRRSVANAGNVTKRYEHLRNDTNSTNRRISYEFVDKEKEENGEREREKEKSPHTPLKEREREEEGKEEKESCASKEKNARARKSFNPPTLAEVEAYAKERGSSVDPKQFWEYFEAGGWIDAKGQPVRAWKQKFLTWEKYSIGAPGGHLPGIMSEEEQEQKRRKLIADVEALSKF